jgi:hypothetical protein
MRSTMNPIVRKTAIVTGLVPVWLVQYLLWVPAVLVARLAVAIVWDALKLGALGLFLLSVPVIGWIALAVILYIRSRNRVAERRHVEVLAVLGHGPAQAPVAPSVPVWQPWLTRLIAA